MEASASTAARAADPTPMDVVEAPTFLGAHPMDDLNFPELARLPPVTWVGRKYEGSVKYSAIHQCAKLRITRLHVTRTFNVSKHGGSRTAAEAAAQRCREELCLAAGMFKNEFGYFTSVTGEMVGVVKLTCGQIGLFNPQSEHIVIEHVWHANRRKTGKWYVASSHKQGEKRYYFHRLVLPNDNPLLVVDHKGRNGGLDNRIENLRLVPHSLNGKNRDFSVSNSNVTVGVRRITGSSRIQWVARGHNGKQRTKAFYVGKRRGEAVTQKVAFDWHIAHRFPNDKGQGVWRRETTTPSVWKAYAKDMNKHEVHRSFSIDRYGEKEAEEHAIALRETWEKLYGYIVET